MFRYMRPIAAALVVSMSALSLPVQAAPVSTEEVIAEQTVQGDRAEVQAFLAREDVARQLASMGVNPAEAQARVAALSDDEARDLAGKVKDMPAAGADVLGVLVFIFIVLLITDILGFTKVFPFTRSIR